MNFESATATATATATASAISAPRCAFRVTTHQASISTRNTHLPQDGVRIGSATMR